MTGDREFVAALNALKAGARNKIVRPAMREAAKLVARKVRVLAPRSAGTKKVGKHLADSFKVRAIKRSRRYVGVNLMSGTRKDLGIPEDAKGYYPFALEYGGTIRTGRGGRPLKKPRVIAARPFLRPAVDQSKDEVVTIWRRRLQEGLDKAVASKGKDVSTGSPES